MRPKPKTILTWIVQILIIAALLGFVFFVFYGPTGQGTERNGMILGKSKRSRPGTLIEGEQPAFALFTPVSTHDSKDPAISYTTDQIHKVLAAANKAGLNIEVFAPKTGTTDDYLKEIRVFQDKHIVQLLYPNFGVMESVNPIDSEPGKTSTEKVQLSIGPAKWVKFKHGGCHLYFHLKDTYIVMDSTDIDQHSRFEKIAESLVPVLKLEHS